MNVTVAICTWNRASLLDQTLAAFRDLQVPQDISWELLVVDNNCTDHTASVIEKYHHALPIRRLLETKQGHCNARNCAIAAAAGDLIVWTDDDVIVDPGWLNAYVEAARRWPQAMYFGGRILPWFEHTPPSWMQANVSMLEGALALRDLGARERLLDSDEHVYGANMAFRREAFAEVRFDPRIGLKKDDGVRGDETQVICELQRRGMVGVWVPQSVVQHFVPAARLTRKYVHDYFKGVGKTKVRMTGVPQGSLLFSAPRWLYRVYVLFRARSLYDEVLQRPSWVASYCKAAETQGIIIESRVALKKGRI